MKTKPCRNYFHVVFVSVSGSAFLQEATCESGRAFDGRIDFLPGGESLRRERSEWCDEPPLVATFSVLAELIDCGHVCVQPRDGGAEAVEAHQIS